MRNIYGLFLGIIMAAYACGVQAWPTPGGLFNGAPFPAVAGTGISVSGNTLSSNAINNLVFPLGPTTTLTGFTGKFGFYKVGNASTVDNILASSVDFTCSVNPTITFYECGTSTTCASSPTTIGSVTITAAGTVVSGTVSNSSITAGDYVAAAVTAGTCTVLDIEGTMQIHAN